VQQLISGDFLKLLLLLGLNNLWKCPIYAHTFLTEHKFVKRFRFLGFQYWKEKFTPQKQNLAVFAFVGKI